jgi:hypothetical protein
MFLFKNISLVLLLSTSLAEAVEVEVNFNQQVRPILANSCYNCHGPDEKTREGKLRLDIAEEALKKAWVPGKPEESEGIRRLNHQDPEKVMPPPEFPRQISAADKAILEKWVRQGAKYEGHWAFTPPVRPEVPNVSALKSFPVRHPVDAFVLEKLNQEKLVPAAEAKPEQWLRRVFFDLTGLPPATQDVAEFLADTSPERFEKTVDRLLASPAFGERMATDWLDAARYADSYGRHEDADSPVWPYRDWVVQAFNANMPYDQFLTWQTAGDMLPNATQESRLATAFNRLVNQSNEAGSNEEEFRQEIIADRIATNSTAILGLTMECARCHDHKYDPISTKEYYSFGAFLNNINELGLYAERTAGIPAPSVYLLDESQKKQHAALFAEIAQAEAHYQKVQEEARVRFAAASVDPPSAQPTDYFSFEKLVKRVTPNHARNEQEFTFRAKTPQIDGAVGKAAELEAPCDLKMPDSGVFHRTDAFTFALWLRPEVKQERAIILHRSNGGLEAASRGYEILLTEMHPEVALSHVAPGNSLRIRGRQPLPLGKWTHVAATYDGSSRTGGLVLWINGVRQEPEVLSDHLYKDIDYRAEWGDFDSDKVQNNVDNEVSFMLGGRYNDMGPKQMGYDEVRIYHQVLTAAEIQELHAGKRPTDETSAFQRYVRDVDEPCRTAYAALKAARDAENEFSAKAHEIMVMEERSSPRETFVLARGKFDALGEKVTPTTPASIFAMPDDFPKNRLGLAKWYVDPRNPLVARVQVNRLWQMLFGKGLVATQEDFGIQGRLPTHPALLDWLAVEFRESGWDIQKLLRGLVLSSVYRQSSHGPSEATDAENLLLARGPKFRLSAEMLRDHALKAAGMLNPEMGGEPVKAYQPEGFYKDSGVQATYHPTHGEALWKRSVYLYRKRTAPLPFLTVFDASTREYCRVRRDVTATPLQALALLNAPEFLEPCRVLAERQTASGMSLAEMLQDSYRRFTSLDLMPKAQTILERAYGQQLAYYQKNPEKAEALLAASGEHPRAKDLPPPAVAALTMIHRLLLSDDDSVMRK